MNTMMQCKTNKLILFFKGKTHWNLARIKFLVAFITALYKVKTVNFLKLAVALGGHTQVESNLRRIQRFFAEYLIDGDLVAKLIFSLLPCQAPYRLCLDRTNWKLGKTDINILTLGVCYEGVAIPILWMMLAKKGNSNQKERLEKCVIIGNFRTDKASIIKKIAPVKEKGKEKKWELVHTEDAAYYYIDDVVIEKATIEKEAKSADQNYEEENKDTLNIKNIEIDSAVVLKNIFFEFNKVDLLPRSYFEISKLRRLMINNPSIRIKLEGHTDNIGSYDFNLQLSLKRAEAVVRYLIEMGINPDRIEYAGYSYSYPLASNETEDGRKTNRRVTFKVIEK